MLEQAFGFQNAENLTDWCGAHAQPLGQILLLELLAWLQVTPQDGGAEHPGAARQFGALFSGLVPCPHVRWLEFG